MASSSHLVPNRLVYKRQEEKTTRVAWESNLCSPAGPQPCPENGCTFSSVPPRWCGTLAVITRGAQHRHTHIHTQKGLLQWNPFKLKEKGTIWNSKQEPWEAALQSKLFLQKKEKRRQNKNKNFSIQKWSKYEHINCEISPKQLRVCVLQCLQICMKIWTPIKKSQYSHENHDICLNLRSTSKRFESPYRKKALWTEMFFGVPLCTEKDRKTNVINIVVDMSVK